MMPSNQTDPVLVTIICLVYNHEPYLRQCLDGFVMQKTDFKVEAIVHDDCSSDNSALIIKEYAEKYPDLIKTIFEKENQYPKIGFSGIFNLILPHIKGKYVAFCEGDDYWTDPVKLQKHVNFLETHPEYSSACSRTRLYSQSKGEFLQRDVFCTDHDEDVPAEDIIRKGGLYLASCSLVYKKEVRGNDYPEYCKKCHVGDYPLQIMCAMKGKVRYFNEAMGVYRVDNSSSWVGKNTHMGITENRLKGIVSELNMLECFSKDYPRYKKAFTDRITMYLFSQIRYAEKADKAKLYRSATHFFKTVDWKGKLLLWAFSKDNRVLQSITYRLNSKRINE